MSCQHNSIAIVPGGYFCNGCNQFWKQLSLIPMIPTPAPTPAPTHPPQNSATVDPVKDGGNSEPSLCQISLFSATVDPVNDGGNIRQVVRRCRSHGKTYYRYRVSQGRQILIDLHIPGGNISREVVAARATEVQRWINLGRSPDSIKDLIASWGDLPT